MRVSRLIFNKRPIIKALLKFRPVYFDTATAARITLTISQPVRSRRRLFIFACVSFSYFACNALAVCNDASCLIKSVFIFSIIIADCTCKASAFANLSCKLTINFADSLVVSFEASIKF